MEKNKVFKLLFSASVCIEDAMEGLKDGNDLDFIIEDIEDAISELQSAAHRMQD